MGFFEALDFTSSNEDGRSELTALAGARRILCLTASGTRPLDLLLSDATEIVALDLNPVQNALLDLKVAAILAFAFGRQQQVDAEMAGYRAGDEAVGRGDDHQGVAGLTVTLDQGQRLGQHDGQDFLLHELLVPGVKLFGRMLAEQLQAEIQVDPDIQSPGQIVVEKLVVTRLVLVRINNPMGNDKLAPGVIAVPAQQGVVEVEDGE